MCCSGAKVWVAKVVGHAARRLIEPQDSCAVAVDSLWHYPYLRCLSDKTLWPECRIAHSARAFITTLCLI
jgi:hypothetical protein